MLDYDGFRWKHAAPQGSSADVAAVVFLGGLRVLYRDADGALLYECVQRGSDQLRNNGSIEPVRYVCPQQDLGGTNQVGETYLDDNVTAVAFQEYNPRGHWYDHVC
jgi:hypothetical protein